MIMQWRYHRISDLNDWEGKGAVITRYSPCALWGGQGGFWCWGGLWTFFSVYRKFAFVFVFQLNQGIGNASVFSARLLSAEIKSFLVPTDLASRIKYQGDSFLKKKKNPKRMKSFSYCDGCNVFNAYSSSEEEHWGVKMSFLCCLSKWRKCGH